MKYCKGFLVGVIILFVVNFFFDFMDRVSDTMQDVLRRILYEHKLGGKVLDNFIVGAARCHLEQYKHQSTLAPDVLNAFGSPLIYRD